MKRYFSLKEVVDKSTRIFQRLIDLVAENLYYKKFLFDSDITIDDVKIHTSDLIKRWLEGNAFCYLIVDSEEISDIIILEYASWESSILESDVYKLSIISSNLDNIELLVDLLNDFLADKHKLLIFYRSRFAPDMLLPFFKRGWTLTGSIITMHKSLKEEKADNNVNIAKGIETEIITPCDANTDIVEEVTKITMDAFSFSHHHHSPYIPYSLAEKIYITWAINSLKGYADIFLTAKERATIVGYLTLKKTFINRKAVNNIDLLAVSRDKRGKKIGYTLLQTLFKTLRRAGEKNVYIATHLNNIPAIRLYEKAGFRTINTEAYLHFWKE